MTRQLDEARSEADRHRAYLESVLANLSAGVLAFDADFRADRPPTVAPAPSSRTTWPTCWATSRWPTGRAIRPWQRRSSRPSARQGREWQQQLEIEGRDGAPQTLLLRGSTLPEAAAAATSSVFDDITPADFGAALDRLGRGGAPARPRDQESADADPAFRGAPANEADRPARRSRARDAEALDRAPSSTRSRR